MARAKHDDELARPRGGRVPWYVHGPAWLAWRFRWQLLPFTVGAGVLVGGLGCRVVAELVGWPWAAGAYGVALLVAVAWIVAGLSDGYRRALGGAATLLGAIWAPLVAFNPAAGTVYLATPIIAGVAGIPWWFGACRDLAELDRVRKRLERGQVGARVLAQQVTKAGRVLHVRRGRGQAWRDVADQVAEVLDVPAGTVTARADRGGNRSGEVRLLSIDMFAVPELPHPALAAGALDPGGPWAPGSRSILDPVPVGQARDGTPIELALVTDEGAARVGVFGKSGSGKSNTLNVLVAAVAACRDAVLLGSDEPKKGSTLGHWAGCFAQLATREDGQQLGDQTAAQMAWLLAEVDRRGGIVAASTTSDKWTAAMGPYLVVMVEEFAALISRRDDIADMATDLARLARQVGVVLILASQGAQYDSVPTSLRGQLSALIAHKMPSADLRKVWPAAAGVIDLDLLERAGMLYVQADGGEQTAENAVPARSYALYRPPDRKALDAKYSTRRPDLDGVTTMDDAAPARLDPRDQIEAAEREAAELLDQPAPAFPDGPASDVYATVPAEVEAETAEDEAVTARVVDVLRKAGDDGARSSELEQAAETSRPTVLRRLSALRGQGRVEAIGNGAQTRWRLVPAAVAGETE